MSLWELLAIGIGLSMDAFAISVCKGLSVHRMRPVHAVIAGGWFGGFQALMPVIGYLLGARFQRAIVSIDHWIAFVLLAFIGGKMFLDASEESCAIDSASFSAKTMFPMAVATSIDALAVGVTFACLQVDLLLAASVIGVTTFLLSAAGVVIGHRFGDRCRSTAARIGGIMLILMGIKILLEHLGIL